MTCNMCDVCVCVCVCMNMPVAVGAVGEKHNIMVIIYIKNISFLKFYVYIFVDLVKCSVLSFVSETLHYSL